MTGRDLLNKMQDALEDDPALNDEAVDLHLVLTIPQLYHLKAAFERLFYDAYYDPKTPCPHLGTKWRLEDGLERCGQCGRRIEQEAA